jgi:hypothetical protein
MWCFGLLITYCTMQTPAPAGNAYCQIAKPIYWSRDDTLESKRQIDRENAKWKRLCGEGRAKK